MSAPSAQVLGTLATLVLSWSEFEQALETEPAGVDVARGVRRCRLDLIAVIDRLTNYMDFHPERLHA